MTWYDVMGPVFLFTAFIGFFTGSDALFALGVLGSLSVYGILIYERCGE